jgi:hypothetical protein
LALPKEKTTPETMTPPSQAYSRPGCDDLVATIWSTDVNVLQLRLRRPRLKRVLVDNVPAIETLRRQSCHYLRSIVS